jgi:hypothetical protein
MEGQQPVAARARASESQGLHARFLERCGCCLLLERRWLTNVSLQVAKLQRTIHHQSARLASLDKEEDVSVLRRYVAELKALLDRSEAQNAEVCCALPVCAVSVTLFGAQLVEALAAKETLATLLQQKLDAALMTPSVPGPASALPEAMASTVSQSDELSTVDLALDASGVVLLGDSVEVPVAAVERPAAPASSTEGSASAPVAVRVLIS